MKICKGDLSFECSLLKTNIVEDMRSIKFDIFDPVTPDDVKKIFDDDKFYFFDEILNDRLPDTDNSKLVGLYIGYNEDSTCKITIKLK